LEENFEFDLITLKTLWWNLSLIYSKIAVLLDSCEKFRTFSLIQV